jgi:hypothetical protein
MSSKAKTGSARTEPKGRPTTKRDTGRSRRSLISPTFEWILAVVVFLLVLVAIFYFLGDVRSTQGSLAAGVPLEVTVPSPPGA